MKKRILFVDDEINILKGLKRSLRSERDHWEMEFAEGGEKGLKLLESCCFDVVVSDMRMPGMDGAVFLGRIKERYPMIIRIILSGYSEQEMVMKTVKAAHQYLAKPCDTAVLIGAIKRACSLRDLLNQDALKELLGGLETIPSLPIVYLKMMEELNSPESDIEKIGDIIAEDMGMTAKILQIVNSSFFGHAGGRISDTKEAVIYLGLDLLKALVLNIEVFSKMPVNSDAKNCAASIQEHSIKTGAIAGKIAEEVSFDPKFSDDLLIAALLHDLGRMLLIQYFSDQYKNVIQLAEQKSVQWLTAERQIFGTSHAEIGAYLLGLWGLPDSVIEGIAFHHEPGRMDEEHWNICGILHIADRIERNSSTSTNGADGMQGLDKDFIKNRHLEEKFQEWQQKFGQG